jgi:hypothetical protein
MNRPLGYSPAPLQTRFPEKGRGRPKVKAPAHFNRRRYRNMLKQIARVLAVGLAVLTVSSCADDKKIAYCPGMTALLDAYMAATFKPGAPPLPSNALYTVEILKVKGHCSFDKEGKTSESSLQVTFGATRSHPGPAAQYTVPYFIAVTQGESIITKSLRKVDFAFPEGAKSTSFEEDIDSVALVTDGEHRPYEYQILVGLQLTKEQLDYNRSIGLFAR